MQSTTIRVHPETHKTLAKLAQENHSSMQTILDEALEAYRREVFLQRTNQAFAELRSDSVAWARYRKDLEAWDGTSEMRPPYPAPYFFLYFSFLISTAGKVK